MRSIRRRLLLFLGVLTCAAAPAAHAQAPYRARSSDHLENLLRQGSFEEASGWSDAWTADGRQAGTVKIVADASADGDRAVRVQNESGDLSTLHQTVRSGIVPGAWYRVAAQVKSEGAGQAPVGRVYWYDADGSLLAAQSASGAASDDWQVISKEIEAPGEATSVRVELRHRGAGQVWWDDARLEKLPRIEDFGPQVFALHHRNAAFVGRKLYIISERRANLAVIDLRTGEQQELIEMDRGSAVTSMMHSNGNVYLGVSGLASIDPATNDVTYLDLPLKGSIRDLMESPDGTIWGGTYPKGALFSYDPTSGDFKNYGPVSEGYNYANSVAWADGKLFVGMGSPARLYVYDPATGDKQQILPEHYQGQSYARFLRRVGDRLFLVIDTSNEGLVLNTDTYEVVRKIPNIESWDYSKPNDHRVYFNTHGKLHAYDLNDDTVSEVESDHTFGNAMNFAWVKLGASGFPGKTLIGTERHGHWWAWNPQTDRFKREKTDMPSVPYPTHELVMGGDGNLWGVGYIGAGGFIINADDQYSSTRIDAPQAEGMVAIGQNLYLGVYPDAEFYRQSVNAPWDPQRLFSLGEEGQNRPFAAHVADKKYYAGTIPLRGKLGGALAVYDTKTGEHRAWRNLSPDQAVTAITTKDSMAYLGTSISGGLSSTPTTDAGKLLVFNLQTEKVEKTLVPSEDAPAVGALTVGPDGNIWGLTKGDLFVFDPSSRKMLRTETLYENARWNPPDHNWGYGETLFVHQDGNFYGANTRHLFRLNPEAGTLTTLYDGPAVQPVEDPDGRIWFIGGADKHLYRYNK